MNISFTPYIERRQNAPFHGPCPALHVSVPKQSGIQLFGWVPQAWYEVGDQYLLANIIEPAHDMTRRFEFRSVVGIGVVLEILKAFDEFDQDEISWPAVVKTQEGT